jgi:hypothetical protein
MKAYRTFGIAVLAAVLLALCALKGVHGEDLQAVKWGLVGIVATVAGRAVGTAAAGGGGLKGIARALTTEAKPDPGLQP